MEDDDIYEGIEYLFDESIKNNGLYYDEIKKLRSVKVKKESIVYEMKQNGLEYEEVKKLLSIQEGKEHIIYETIKDKIIGFCKIIEDQMAEDINMIRIERKLNLTKDELKVLAIVRGVKNYENLSKRKLIEQINKLKTAEIIKKVIMIG